MSYLLSSLITDQRTVDAVDTQVVENPEVSEAGETEDVETKPEGEADKEEVGYPEPADTPAEATETDGKAEVQDESKDTETSEGSESRSGESKDDQPAPTESSENEKQEDNRESNQEEEGKENHKEDLTHESSESLSEESKDQVQEEIRPHPAFEVVDGTTIYLNDLEPTPLPSDPANEAKPDHNTPQETPNPEHSDSEQGDVFKMQASDVVDVHERADNGVAPPPTTFSVQSEEDIDPVAYRNILHKLHANPHLKDKEGAIQQEMLKILRNPELKKNLLVKPQPQKMNILSNFRSHPKPDQDIVTLTENQEEAEEEQLIENMPSTENAHDNQSMDSPLKQTHHPRLDLIL